MRYLVTYSIIHTREFNVPDVGFIESVLSEENQCDILGIEEVSE